MFPARPIVQLCKSSSCLTGFWGITDYLYELRYEAGIMAHKRHLGFHQALFIRRETI